MADGTLNANENTTPPPVALFMAESRLPYLKASQWYSYRPVVSGGVPPYSAALIGSLPSGLSHSTTTGEISGTPTADTTVGPFMHTVTDSIGGTTTRVFYLGANPTPVPLPVIGAGSVVPARAILNSTGGYVLNSTGGYVLSGA